MLQHTWNSLPADRDSIDAVAANGLEYRVIDTGDAEVFDPYLQAEMRGFLGPEQSVERLGALRDGLAFRRFTGVYDPAALEPRQPVGTVNSWITEVALPGGGIPLWAISGVTVSGTHRRKGIARAMLEGELRTAAAAGVALAGLTVSEATIYGRFGFSPATFGDDWTIDTRRARWIGPRPDGRLDFIARDRARDELAELHERVRATRPGEIAVWPGFWSRLTGTAPGIEGAEKIRAVRYADPAGITRGIALYRLSDEGPDFTKHELSLLYVLTETPDAYAAIWRFVLEHDLVSVVKAHLLSVDEPVRWMIADQRGATVESSEHHWLRVLDVPAVLAARTYSAPGVYTLRVIDPLGFADGVWRLTIDDTGAGEVVATDAEPRVTMTVNALSSLVLGGVRAASLHAAGLVDGDPDVLTHLDRSFASARTPYLGLWY
ncbi:MAG TPA: GNAT family N-acetyltransferase [Microbacterium sp.]|uniref:GNAT family N-acetyltransferase n=1 Tax=Microbacterium sp. TaxID=51671 RepID=UPI002CD5D269|nr:GNAT family N-acetyltransferase [Microbacterium sp.]HWI31311.1 GNAT family N-acetyltransferase [Microbacterium sp.]